LERFNAQLKEDDRLEMGRLSPATLKQHELVDKVARLQYDRLLELRPDPRDRARLLSLRQPNSVLTALNAPPNPRRELHLSNARFPLAIRFILGKLPQEGEKCSLCGSVLDRHGFHATAQCSEGKAKKYRHDLIAKAISREGQRGGLSSTLDKALFPDKKNPQRPADVQFTSFANGRDAAFDVSVVSPLQHNYLNRAATDFTHVHKETDAKKRRKYSAAIDRARELRVDFHTLVVDSYGNWSTSARDTFKRLTKLAADVSGVNVGRERAAFHQRLAMILLQQLTWSIIDRRPVPPPGPGGSDRP
jgi:hypothetical protein